MTKREKIKNRKIGLEDYMNFQDLKYKYELLKDLMSHVPDVIYFKDRQGRLIMVNEAHAKGLGLRPEEVIGKTDFDIFPKERAEKMVRDDLQVMATGRPIIDKIERATRPDGLDNYVSTTKIPRYNDKGEIIGLVGITRDITHRMQLKRLEEEEERAKKKLEYLKELNRLKSEFVSAVSHELRTPLAMVKDAIGLIFERLAGPINKKQKKLLINASNNIRRLQHIIDELLEVSRIETGKLKLHYSLVNLNDLITDSSAFFKKLAAERGINLSYHLPKDKINIFVDAERIIQVINNLISNAIKFTEEGGEIKVELKVLEDKVRLGIQDTGVGIAKQDLPKLFHKFTQVSKTSGAEKKGVGLGLSIAKELVDRHGGEIWAESILGVGSKFYFTLPRFYVIEALNKHLKDQINNLLKEEKTVSLIDVVIVHFREIGKKIKIKPARLIKDLKNIIVGTLKSWFHLDVGRFRIAGIDKKTGEYNIIFTDLTERKVAKVSELLISRINDYFAKNKLLEDIFINIGIGNFPYFFKKELRLAHKFIGNFYVKKIYIGLEKRRFKRVRYEGEIEISSSRSGRGLAQTVDVSPGGLCFLSNRQLKTDEQIEIRLKFPAAKKTLHLRGQIAWIKRIEEVSGGISKYKVGIEFSKVKNQDRKILIKFIKSLPSLKSAVSCISRSR